jgi:hypothetical protein
METQWRRFQADTGEALPVQTSPEVTFDGG